MILVHFLIALFVLFVAIFQRLDFLQLYGWGVEYVQLLPWTVYAWLIATGCVLLLVTVILEYMKSYTFMYLLSRCVFELSLFAISFLSLWAIFFGWYYLQHLWLDMIPLVFMPYASLAVSLMMFQLFDFNYPFKARVVVTVLLSGLSVVLVFLHLM